MENNKMIRITGLWTNKTKEGKQFLSGRWGSTVLFVFKNDKKRPNSKDPDFSVCLAPVEREDQPSSPPKDDDIFQ